MSGQDTVTVTFHRRELGEVRNAIATTAEVHEMEAVNRKRTRGHDRYVTELTESADLLRGVLERIPRS